MAKKDKKYAAPEGQVEAQTDAQAAALQGNGEANTEGAAEAPAVVAKPQLFLEHSDGTQYQYTRMQALPKRAAKAPAGDMTVSIDGVEVPAWTTSSKGWAAPDKVLDYIWVEAPDGSKGYITLDYLVPAATFDKAEFTWGEGKATRENPSRVAKDQAKEDNRKDLFRTTMAKKKVETPAEGETGSAEDQAEGAAAAG